MFTVIITEKGGDQRRQDFDKAEVTIGRVQGNDIILPKGNVSKRHSRIVFKDGKFIIVDLKSTNGTYVNGRKITSPLVIKETDKIYIGDFILTVEEAGGAQVTAPPMANPTPQVQSGMGPPPMGLGMGGPSMGAPPMPGGGMGAQMAPPEPMVPPPAMHPPPPAPPRKSIPPPPARRPSADDQPGVDSGLDAESDLRPPGPGNERPTMPRPAAKGPGSLGGPGPMNDVGMRQPSVVPRDPLAARAAAVGAPHPPGRSAEPLSPPPGREPAPPMGMGAGAPAARDGAGPRLVGVGAPSARSAPANASSPAAQPVVAPPPQIIAQPAPIAPPDPKRTRALELQREVNDRLTAQLELTRVPIERLGEESLWQRAEGAVVDIVEQLDGEGAIPSFIDQDSLIKDSLNEALGLGPLEDLLADEEVSDVLVNRPDRVIIEKQGRLQNYEKGFSSDAALKKVIERLAAPSGRKVDENIPLIDLRLRDGARLTAAVPPLAVRGACLTLRKPRRASLTMDDLVRAGALSTQIADFLATCVAARRNVVVCGGTGAGKTSMLAALSSLAPPAERIVSVEEVAELALGRDHWIALESRPPDHDGKGGVSLREVLQAALRMRPDRLVVGEVRGAEAFELVSAMASAHDGTLVSVVAEGARSALARMESLARLGAADAAGAGVREVVAQAVHVVVHLMRYGDGVRRVASIAEVVGVEKDGYAVRELFSFHVQGHGADGAVRGRFAGNGVVPRFYEVLEARGMPADPAVFNR